MYFDANNKFVLQKLATNALQFRISLASVDYDCTVTSANYSWRVNDWVHLRFEWDDSPASGPEQRIVINQAVPTQTCPGNFTSPGGSPGPNFDFRFGDINDGAATFGAGVYDEIYSFGGSSTTPTPLANGGLATPGREYLGDTAQNCQLTFVTREDVTFRGPRLFVGSDSKFLGLNIALAIKGASPDANLRIHYWNGMAWTILSDTDTPFWVPGFSDTSNSLRQNGTMSWTEALVELGPLLRQRRSGPLLHPDRQQFGTYTTPPTEALITTDILLFQYCADVTAAAQTFVFSVPPTTEVKLQSFSATPGDSSVRYGGGGGGDAGYFAPGATLAYVHRVNDRLRLGLIVGSYFGLGLDYGDHWSGRYYIQDGKSLTAGTNPSIGYRVNDWLSIGGGITMEVAKLYNKVAVNTLLPGMSDGRLKYEDMDLGFGYNLGILVELSKKTRFGLTYRSEVDFKFKDKPDLDGEGWLLDSLLNLRNQSKRTLGIDMTIPQAVMFSAYHQLNDRFRLCANFGWQDWSEFGQPEISISGNRTNSFTADLNYDDTYHVAFGGQYRLAPKWLMSAGMGS